MLQAGYLRQQRHSLRLQTASAALGLAVQSRERRSAQLCEQEARAQSEMHRLPLAVAVPLHPSPSFAVEPKPRLDTPQGSVG